MCTDKLGEGGAHCWGGSSGFYSTSSPRPPPKTHTVFLYSLRSLSCNSRNICAQVCWRARALGPPGGWGIHGALQKILLILLLCSSFPCFSSAFASPPLRRAFRFLTARATFLPSTRHLRAICNQTRWSRLSFLHILCPRCHFLSDSLLHLCF